MPTRPVRSPDETGFWEGADRRELVVQRCESCGLRRHPPVPMCGGCGSVSARFEAVSGRGTVMSSILSRHPNGTDEPPSIIVLVELEEGVRLVSNLIDAGSPPYEDMAVEADFLDGEGATMPVFRPVNPQTR